MSICAAVSLFSELGCPGYLWKGWRGDLIPVYGQAHDHCRWINKHEHFTCWGILNFESCPLTKCRKVMFSHVSVCLFTGEGVPMWRLGMWPPWSWLNMRPRIPGPCSTHGTMNPGPYHSLLDMRPTTSTPCPCYLHLGITGDLFKLVVLPPGCYWSINSQRKWAVCVILDYFLAWAFMTNLSNLTN